MSSPSPTPMQRAQRFIRPKLKPKSPLRQKEHVSLPNTPASPTEIRSPTSSNSSTSGHGHGGSHVSSSGNGMMRSYSASSSAGTLSTSNSGNSLFGSSPKTANVQHVQMGDYAISLPALVIVGAGLFAGGLVLRAIVTFSASLLRLFVLVVVVVAAITFSQFSEKQGKVQNGKAATAAAQAARFAEAAANAAAAAKTQAQAASTASTAATATIRTTYNSGDEFSAPAVIDVSAYGAKSGANKSASTLLSSPYVGHNYGYGHTKYSSAPSTTQNVYANPPAYSTDGRTRQLLAPHQRS